jgi:hypothetical protein
MASYGVGTTSIGGLTIDNPLRLENTKAPASTATSSATAAPAPAPAPASTNTDTTSGGGAFVDPYAAWGGYAGYQQAVSDFNSQKAATYGSITDRENNEASGYHSGLLDFIDSLTSGQRKIDASAVQNELAKRQGTAGVYDMIGHGVKSAGVTLANRNSGTSSAGDAVARAYADIGRRQLSGVGNQYEKGKAAIDSSESDLQLQTAQGMRHLSESKLTISNGIVSDAQNAISALNAKAASASLPERIDIEAEKQRIRNEALGKLQAFDAELNQGVASAAPASVDTNRANAEKLYTAGTAPENAFTFDTSTPAQFQNTGPFASDLPIFSPVPKKQTA